MWRSIEKIVIYNLRREFLEGIKYVYILVLYFCFLELWKIIFMLLEFFVF